MLELADQELKSTVINMLGVLMEKVENVQVMWILYAESWKL